MWAMVCVKYNVVHLFDRRARAEQEVRAFDEVCGMHHILTNNVHVDTELLDRSNQFLELNEE